MARWQQWIVGLASVVLAALCCLIVGFDITQLVVGPIVFVTLTFLVGWVLVALMTGISRHRDL